MSFALIKLTNFIRGEVLLDSTTSIPMFKIAQTPSDVGQAKGARLWFQFRRFDAAKAFRLRVAGL